MLAGQQTKVGPAYHDLRSLPEQALAGKGPLEEAASAMFSQSLGKHGLGARPQCLQYLKAGEGWA